MTAFTGGSALLAYTVGNLVGAYNPTPPPDPGWVTTNYTYPASGPGAVRPHAVTGLSTGETYSYDANGNMTQRVEGGLTLRLRSGQALHPEFRY